MHIFKRKSSLGFFGGSHPLKKVLLTFENILDYFQNFSKKEICLSLFSSSIERKLEVFSITLVELQTSF